MAVQAPPTQVPADYDRHAADDERGSGWIMLAGTLLLMMPAYPFGSPSIFTLDILVIYGLIAYGKRISSAA